MTPSLLGEGKKCKRDSCRWHSWAKDLGASDTKKPWERHWGRTSLGRTRGRRWELRVWSLDSEPQGTFLGMKNAWEGEIPQERQVSQRGLPLTHWAGNQNVLAVPV